jgi:pyruvate/2-oxoglutarate dehydrogenase complex dihydrolipoamide dehydrogenase (E3) component
VEARTRPRFDQDHDLVVIGGGPAGAAAAQAARWSGARVALVADGPGGDRLPRTAFVLAARSRRPFREAVSAARSVLASEPRRDRVSALRRQDVDIVEGRARFVDPGEIEVDSRRLRSGRFVIATGSIPSLPAIDGIGTVPSLTPDELVVLHDAPPSIAIIGAGSSGCELAQACARVGIHVVLFEARERILPAEDAEAAKVVANAIRRDGVDVREGARVRAVERDGSFGAVRVIPERGESVRCDRLVVAVGRTPVTEDLDLAAADVETDGAGFVKVDEHLRTSARGTYAAGDVTGMLSYSHAAAEMGRLAAGHALKRGPRGAFRANWIPRVIYTDPEVAVLGISEHDAHRWDRVAEVPFTDIERAVAERRTEGFCKLIAGPRTTGGRLYGGRLLGATIVGPNAGELIAEVTLAMRAGMFPARLAQAAHAHPTWSVAVQTCAAQFVVEIDGRRARRPRKQ